MVVRQVEQRFLEIQGKLAALSQIVAQQVPIMQNMVGVILTLRKRGIINDDEIKQALIDSHTKGAQGGVVQPEGAGTDEDRSGDGGLRILSKPGSGRDDASEGKRIGERIEESTNQEGNPPPGPGGDM